MSPPCLTNMPPPLPPAVILDYLSSKRISSGDLVVVSPDVGGVARARAFAKKLNDAPLAIVDKRRSAHNVRQGWQSVPRAGGLPSAAGRHA